MLPLLFVFAVRSAQVDLYVSDRGDDARSGKSWSSAFKSVERAKSEVQSLQGRPVVVHLRGQFRLSQPLILDRKCSESIWKGERGAGLCGSVAITGWKDDRYNGIPVWSAPLPSGLEPTEMFVGRNSDRAERPRLPENGFYQLAGLTNGAMTGPWNEGQTEAIFSPGDIKNFKNLSDVELVAHHYWVSSRLPIKSVDASTNLVTFQKKSVFRLTDNYEGKAAPYYLDNVGEALHRSGQWYWDRAQDRIYYVPRAGDRKSDLRAEVPNLSNLITIQGANSVQLVNLNLTGAEWRLPADSAGDGQAAISVPGAVKIIDSRECAIMGSRVHASGVYGIELTQSSGSNVISSCEFDNLGGGGVKVGHGTTRTTIENCKIHDNGQVYASAIGVWIGNSGNNHVSHNTICRQGYTGISAGWTWGYGPSDATNNVIEWNDIYDIGQSLLSDMGGIYTLGKSAGTVLSHNRIRNVIARGYGGWGVYLDEGSSDILVEDNEVLGCKTGSFHQHYGQDNIVRNNVFEFAKQDGQIIRTRPEPHNSFTMERNVIVWSDGPLFGGNLQGPGFVFKNNLLWNTNGRVDLPSFVDGSNIVANPKSSIDPNGEFVFHSYLELAKVGFVPFSMSSVGAKF